MKNSSKQYLYSVVRQAWQELRLLGAKAASALMRTPLPKIVLLLVGAALFLTIVPLVLTLFVIFMLVKIFLLLVAINVSNRNTSNQTDQSNRTKQPYQWRNQDFEDVQLVRVEHRAVRPNAHRDEK
jgi:hypothetical protein